MAYYFEGKGKSELFMAPIFDETYCNKLKVV